MSNQTQGIAIFLDMDGVISDFDSHYKNSGFVKTDGTPDYKRMNDVCYYADMPVYKGAREFYDALQNIAPVRILTAPITHSECFAGKAEWLMKFLPERKNGVLKDIIIMASQDKHLVAAAGRILIDDRKSNVDAWRKAGGIAIHHTGDFEASMEMLKKEIAQY